MTCYIAWSPCHTAPMPIQQHHDTTCGGPHLRQHGQLPKHCTWVPRSPRVPGCRSLSLVGHAALPHCQGWRQLVGTRGDRGRLEILTAVGMTGETKPEPEAQGMQVNPSGAVYGLLASSCTALHLIINCRRESTLRLHFALKPRKVHSFQAARAQFGPLCLFLTPGKVCLKSVL